MARLSLVPVASLVVCAGALAAAVALGSRAWSAAPAAPSAEPLRFHAVLTPRAVHFGDRLEARLAISADATADPEKVGVRAQFTPYRVVGAPRLERGEAGGRSVLTHVYRLECIAAECLPGLGEERELRFPPATVRIGEEAYAIEWPTLSVASRVTPAEASAGALRADATDPAQRAARSPWLGWLLVGGGGLLLGALVAGLLRPAPSAFVRVPAGPEQGDALAVALRRAEQHLGSPDPERRLALEDLAAALAARGREAEATFVRGLAWSRDRAAPMPVLTALAEVKKAA